MTVKDIANFTTVDGAPDARWFVDFMDLANSVPGYDEIRRTLAHTLGDLAGKSVLEVGCGTGDDARELAGLVGESGKVVATDLSAAMLDEARRRGPGEPARIEFRYADLAHLPFADDSFDGARAKMVLMHCEEIDTAIDELVRVTRTGGRIAAFDFDFDATIVDHADQVITRALMRCYSDGHRNNWSGRQLVRRFRERDLGDLVVVPQTVRIPFRFFQMMTAGRLAGEQEANRLPLSVEELASWRRSR
ncbi:methyltransferase domain-containing protein [Streptacidiphilus pinicola]|nr:methyltransferase domain-containing protein [Streptacidiphilus pinicola]